MLDFVKVLRESDVYLLGTIVDENTDAAYKTPNVYVVFNKETSVVEAQGTILYQMVEFYEGSAEYWDDHMKEKTKLSVVGDDDGPVRH